MYWRFRDKSPVPAVLLAAGWLAFGIALGMHLAVLWLASIALCGLSGLSVVILMRRERSSRN